MLEFHQKFVDCFYNGGEFIADILRQIFPYICVLLMLIPVIFSLSIIPLLVTGGLISLKDKLREVCKK